jgi:hypothetical protein
MRFPFIGLPLMPSVSWPPPPLSFSVATSFFTLLGATPTATFAAWQGFTIGVLSLA